MGGTRKKAGAPVAPASPAAPDVAVQSETPAEPAGEAAPASTEPVPVPATETAQEEIDASIHNDVWVGYDPGVEGGDFSIEGKTFRVRSANRKPRRRAGLAFGNEAVDLEADDLTTDQIGQLLGDPQLSVEIV